MPPLLAGVGVQEDDDWRMRRGHLAEATCELVIIGGGPAGFTAALYTARAGLDTLVVSPGELTGMMSRAPIVENFPGQMERLPGREILAKLRQQALSAGARHDPQEVSMTDFSSPEAFLVAAGRELYTTAAVIIATGAMGRAEQLPGEEKKATHDPAPLINHLSY